MNSLTVTVFASLVVFGAAKPSGIWSDHGAAVNVVPAGPTTLVGASGVVGPNGATGPAGTVNGRGAIGPNGEHNALAQHVGIVAAPIVAPATRSAIVTPAIHGSVLATPAIVQHSAAVIAPVASITHASILSAPALVQHSALSAAAIAPVAHTPILAPAVHGVVGYGLGLGHGAY